MTLAPLTPPPTPSSEPPSGPYIVMVAWHCDNCDVQGRTPADAKLACWNCDGQVTVTARPSLRLDELCDVPAGADEPAHVPAQ